METIKEILRNKYPEPDSSWMRESLVTFFSEHPTGFMFCELDDCESPKYYHHTPNGGIMAIPITWDDELNYLIARLGLTKVKEYWENGMFKRYRITYLS